MFKLVNKREGKFMGKTNEISAFEAKTHLSQLLRETERGRSFVIRRRGKIVACLVPPVKGKKVPDITKLSAAFRQIRKRIKGPLHVRELIEEGRRL